VTEAEEQFIQVCTKDICRSPSIGVHFKFVSSNVNRDVTKYGFLTTGVTFLLVSQYEFPDDGKCS
jgi:hypothetical protein